MSERKYQAVKQQSILCQTVPYQNSYNSLVNEIKKIDVGKVYSTEEEFSSYIDDENINGCYRDLRECLPRLATFYLNMQGKGALK